jgi:hypothetical protein
MSRKKPGQGSLSPATSFLERDEDTLIGNYDVFRELDPDDLLDYRVEEHRPKKISLVLRIRGLIFPVSG